MTNGENVCNVGDIYTRKSILVSDNPIFKIIKILDINGGYGVPVCDIEYMYLCGVSDKNIKHIYKGYHLLPIYKKLYY
jgi:hypothetical protein